MSDAERQRAYRARRGVDVGGRPGPKVTRPCGTLAAYRRHVRNREPIDDACAAEWARIQHGYYLVRKAARAGAGGEDR